MPESRGGTHPSVTLEALSSNGALDAVKPTKSFTPYCQPICFGCSSTPLPPQIPEGSCNRKILAMGSFIPRVSRGPQPSKVCRYVGSSPLMPTTLALVTSWTFLNWSAGLISPPSETYLPPNRPLVVPQYLGTPPFGTVFLCESLACCLLLSSVPRFLSSVFFFCSILSLSLPYLVGLVNYPYCLVLSVAE